MIPRSSITILALAGTLSALLTTGPDPDPDAGDPQESPRTGTVRGEVVVPATFPRRVAERYPAAGGGASREQPRVPIVVVVEGVSDGRGSAPATAELVQSDTTFVPALAVVPVGGTVAFPNRDPFFHNVFSYSRAKRFDLGRFPQGDTREVSFDSPGYVKVFCEVHEWMRAAVAVVEGPHALVGEDGTFSIEGVPAGRHVLSVTDFDRGTHELEIEVRAGEVTELRVELDG